MCPEFSNCKAGLYILLYHAVEKLEPVSAIFIDIKFTLIDQRIYGTFIAILFLGQAEMETVVNGCFIMFFLQNITFICFMVKLLLSSAFRFWMKKVLTEARCCRVPCL